MSEHKRKYEPLTFALWEQLIKTKADWLEFVFVEQNRPSWVDESIVPQAEIWFYFYKMGKLAGQGKTI